MIRTITKRHLVGTACHGSLASWARHSQILSLERSKREQKQRWWGDIDSSSDGQQSTCIYFTVARGNRWVGPTNQPTALTQAYLAPHAEAKQWKRLPKFRNLPSESSFPRCTWEVFGREDQLGTLNLQTDHLRARVGE